MTALRTVADEAARSGQTSLCALSGHHLRMYVASAPILIGRFEEVSMNAEKVNTWLSLSANIGVVIGLGLLGFEISQNTEMMQAQMNQSRTDTAVSQQEATYNSDYMPALFVKADKGEQFSDEESLRYSAYFRAYNRNMDNQLWQYNQGFLGENIPRSIKGGARARIAGNSLGLELWEIQKYSYTDEYVAFVEEAIADRL